MGGLQVEPLIGVLALQGAFHAHQIALADCGVGSREVRTKLDLAGIDGLIIPGGESTTMSNLLLRTGLFDAIKEVVSSGLPTFGTCAGMIMLARQVLDGRADQVSFSAMDIEVKRNAYGRQVDSFETEITVDVLDRPFHAVFIRAPRVENIGAGVQVLAQVDGAPVLVRDGSNLAASFHPELSQDSRIHKYFIDSLVRTRINSNN